MIEEIFQKTELSARTVAVLEADENGVLADHLDLIPLDDDIILPAEQAEALEPSIDDNGHQLGAGGVDFHVVDAAQAGSVLDVDHFFVSHIDDTAIQSSPPPCVIYMWRAFPI